MTRNQPWGYYLRPQWSLLFPFKMAWHARCQGSGPAKSWLCLVIWPRPECRICICRWKVRRTLAPWKVPPFSCIYSILSCFCFLPVSSRLVVCHILVSRLTGLAVDGSGHKSKSFEEGLLNDNNLIIIELSYLSAIITRTFLTEL